MQIGWMYNQFSNIYQMEVNAEDMNADLLKENLRLKKVRKFQIKITFKGRGLKVSVFAVSSCLD